MKQIDDTIVAISTAIGSGGIGIVRLSGKEALSIIGKMFVPKTSADISKYKSHTIHYGVIVDKKNKDEVVDEVLLNIMKAPKTYTKEDIVEINCHGGIVATKAILALSLELGARLAEPGEFTKRAFLNGRIDLTQAEAVLDIIQAKTDAFLKVSTNQLKGYLTIKLEEIREDLMNVYAQLEAAVNFPEDDIDVKNDKGLFALLDSAKEKTTLLLQSSEQGKLLKEGISIVICGRPNVGKSSLLNVFLQTPRAIVSDIPGTTRDTIEETTQIDGIPFQLVDTAGVIEPRNIIEEEAVKRSHLYMQSADIVLFILDGSDDISDEDKELRKFIEDQNVIVVINKYDLKQNLDRDMALKFIPGKRTVFVSAVERSGIDELKRMIIENVLHGKTVDTHGVLISNMRHVNSLEEALGSIEKGRGLLEQDLSKEFISEEIKVAVNCLDVITGRNIDADLLDNIFSNFCIGK